MSLRLPPEDHHGRRGWLAGMAACVCGWSVAPVRAASPSAPVSLRFAVFSPRPPSEAAYVAAPGQAPTRLRFHPLARSPRYEYRGPAPLRFVNPRDRALLAEAELPAGVANTLIVLLPDEKAAGRWRTIVLDDGETRFRAGQLVLVNLSGLDLDGTLNNRPLKPGPGPNAALPVPRTSQLVLRTSVRGAAYQALATELNLGEGERALLLVLPPLRPGTFAVQHRLLVDRPGTRVSR
ncbi:MAG: hypothetical protein FJ381_07430 [Verrucomicrobia bacterium]|nr:hypothetical protein [Verrucomicrobiota bacterium]